MANHPLTGAYLPTQASDPPAGGTQISQAVNQLSPVTVPRFTSTAARDSAYSSWVSGGGAMVDGMLCAVGSTLYMRRSGAWQTVILSDSDTGWLSLTLSSGWTSGGFSRYRVRNGVFFYTLFATRSSWAAATQLFQIPSDAYRPTYQITCFGIYTGSPREVQARPDGSVLISDSGSGGLVSSGSWPIG